MGDKGAPITLMVTYVTRLVYRRTPEINLGMRMREFLLLAYLRDNADVSQQELVEMLWMDPNNVVILLNRVEESGWAVRRRDPKNRRRHFVELTAQGRGALEKAEDAVAAIEDELVGPLTVKERATLERLLSKVVGATTPMTSA